MLRNWRQSTKNATILANAGDKPVVFCLEQEKRYEIHTAFFASWRERRVKTVRKKWTGQETLYYNKKQITAEKR